MFKFINKIIRLMIVSDFALNLGWGLVGPIFALFILQRITFDNPLQAARIAGTAAFCYWLTRSILTIPIGQYLDKNHGEKDDFWFMFLGTFLDGFVPLGFLISSHSFHIYFLQIIHAINISMVVPSWLSIFTKHIDKGREALEWSLESTFLSIGAGIAGALGGIIASFIGFKTVFLLVSLFTFISSFLLLFIRKDILPQSEKIKFPFSFLRLFQ